MNKRIATILTVFSLFMTTALLFAQTRVDVSGVVKDEAGQPVIGASVVVKGSTTGAATDIDGRYSISAPSEAILEYSYVGMITVEEPVRGRTIIDIVLREDYTALEGVVVVGYGTQKRGSITGSVAAVSGEDVVKTKTENPQNMLTGRVPGVRVWQRTAEPGSYDARLDIRGLGSPLVVIDGVPRGMDDFQRLAPGDIENVSVLKDAAAAIYGLRGGNGVILVTTKAGKVGKAKVSYDGNYTFQTPASLPRQMDAISSMRLVNERGSGGLEGGAHEFDAETIQKYIDGELVGTDWNSLVVQNIAPQFRHDFSISGGSEKIQYYVGLGYFYQEGFWKGGDLNYNKYNLRSNITAEMFDGMKFNLNLSAYSDSQHNPYDNSELIIRYWWKQSTIWKAYADPEQTMLNYQDLELDWNSAARVDSDISGYRRNDRKNMTLTTSFDYDFGALSDALQGLHAKGMFSYDYLFAQNETYRKEYYQYAFDENTGTYNQKLYADSSPNQLTRVDNTYGQWLAQALLSYDRDFEKHHVGGVVGWEVQRMDSNGFSGFTNLEFATPYFTASSIENHQVSQGSLYDFAYKSLFGRLNYGYDNRYLVEGQFRYDGSSKFYQGHQWGFFPSVSAGWRVSEEPFVKNTPALAFINNLKLRVSYGEIGDDGNANYEWATGYVYPAASLTKHGFYTSRAPVYHLGSWVMRANPMALANHNVTWLTNKTFNAGVDFELWKGLLGGSFDYFRRHRTGLMARNTAALPTIIGATAPLENMNDDEHKGFELELYHRNRVGDFDYQVKGMLTITRQVCLDYNKDQQYGNSWDNWRNNNLYQRYQGIQWGYEVVGRYESWEDIWSYDKYKDNGIKPGNFKYLDWNGDGEINGLDVHPYTFNQIPWMNFSLSFDGSWKNLDLSILFQGSALGSVQFGEPQLGVWGQHGGGMLEQFYDRWHPSEETFDTYDQTITWIKGTYAYGGTSADANSDFNIQPIDYLRLKSVEIGYTLPRIRSIRDLGIRIYANAYNPFTWTGVKYIDPEHPADSYGRLYPLNKSYTIGLNLTF